MMISAVIFDYGGTMTVRGRSEYSLIAELFDVSRESARKKSRGCLHAFQRGEITEREFFRSLLNSFGSRLPTASLEPILGDYSSFSEPKREMVEIVLRLRDLGCVTALLSNTIKPHADFNRSRGNFMLFSPVILSCEVGMRKPEKGIYELALARIGKRPFECVFMDDNPKYVAPAKGLGMKTILLKSPGQARDEMRGLGLEI
jgi:epoxide hydrolase-like predicted phosphatase